MLKVDIAKKLADFTLKIAFDVNQEILVLFGPSGAGKSLTLNCISGLIHPDQGVIQIGHTILYQENSIHIPPHKRGIGVVFQGYALFPHMTISENLRYGLRYHPNTQADIKHMLGRLRLENLANRYPHQLSGGQQQRVALGRALIIKPQLLLLDEPFAALDVGVREQLQADILNLQQELKLTIIYVTHQLEDTFVLGDKLAVLQAGKLQQFGPISEVFHRPNSRAVAEITGVKNICEGTVKESTLSGLQIKWGDLIIERPPADVMVGESVAFYIRPEHIKIIHPDKPLTDTVRYNILDVVITNIVHQGTTISMNVKSASAPQTIQLRFPQHSYEDMSLMVGSTIAVSLLREFVMLLPSDS